MDTGGAARIGELDCYVSSPLQPIAAGVLVLAPDLWGLDGGSVRGACDELAAAGYLVVAPDFSRRGQELPDSGLDESERGQEWLQRFKRAHKCKLLDASLRFLRKAGMGRVGTVGFSCGAWATAQLSRDTAQVQASIWCYPSRLSSPELETCDAESELAAAVAAPTLILPSRNSPELYADGDLANAMRSNGVETEVVYFKGASIEWLAEQADGWFAKHLSK